jgi:hypothetical protein
MLLALERGGVIGKLYIALARYTYFIRDTRLEWFYDDAVALVLKPPIVSNMQK